MSEVTNFPRRRVGAAALYFGVDKAAVHVQRVSQLGYCGAEIKHINTIAFFDKALGLSSDDLE